MVGESGGVVGLKIDAFARMMDPIGTIYDPLNVFGNQEACERTLSLFFWSSFSAMRRENYFAIQC